MLGFGQQQEWASSDCELGAFKVRRWLIGSALDCRKWADDESLPDIEVLPTYPTRVIAHAIVHVFKTDDAKIAHAVDIGDEFRNRVASFIERQVVHPFRQSRQAWAH